METVERWWNGRHGTELGDEVRRDARLLRDGEDWYVEVRLGGGGGESERSDPGNEAWARRLLTRTMAARGGGWRQV